MRNGRSYSFAARMSPPKTVLTLFGKRQMIEFTALAKPRWSGSMMPMR